MVYIKVANSQKELDGHFKNLPHNGIGKIRGTKTVTYEIKQTKEIRYITTDNQVITLLVDGIEAFGANIISNTYDTEMGLIVFDNYIKFIGDNAFSGMTNLKAFVIDGGIDYIGVNAFKNCVNLKIADFTSGVNTIDDYAFENTTIEHIFIPASTTYISDTAFNNCYNINTIEVEKGNPYYASHNGNAIYDEKNKTIVKGCDYTLMNEIYCQYKLTPYTFADSRNLTTAIISDKNEEVPAYAFCGCTSLTTVVFMGDSLNKIGDKAFFGCAFTSITFPNSVTSFGISCLENNSKLTEVVIPQSCLMIAQNAFRNCFKFKRIVLPITDPPSLMYGAFDNTNNCPIYVPMSARAAYDWEWSAYTNVLKRIVGY